MKLVGGTPGLGMMGGIPDPPGVECGGCRGGPDREDGGMEGPGGGGYDDGAPMG